MRLRLILLAIVVPLGLAAQEQAPSTDPLLQVRIAKLTTASDDLQHHLPSFACKESLISQELRGDKVKREVRATGELRVMRDGEGKPVEQFLANAPDGTLIPSGRLKAPIYVSGGFANALDYFGSEMKACFRYSGSSDRVDFESSPDVHTDFCEHHSETKGFALVNEDGDITHLERLVPYKVAQQRNTIPFASIDLSRIVLGTSSFLLSTHVIAIVPIGKDNLRWEANYSECQLFSVNVRIGPATPVEADPGVTPDGHGPPHP